MTGYELIEQLMKLTPEQLSMDVVNEGAESWHYSTGYVKLGHVKDGILQEDGPNDTIIISIIF